jgi:hypothetical protein
MEETNKELMVSVSEVSSNEIVKSTKEMKEMKEMKEIRRKNKPTLPFLIIPKSSEQTYQTPISYAPTTEYPPL